MQFGDPEYYVKRIGPNAYQVAKFLGGFAPEHVYTVRFESCTCPKGWDCKHVRLTEKFAQFGDPPMAVWQQDPNTGVWEFMVV